MHIPCVASILVPHSSIFCDLVAVLALERVHKVHNFTLPEIFQIHGDNGGRAWEHRFVIAIVRSALAVAIVWGALHLRAGDLLSPFVEWVGKLSVNILKTVCCCDIAVKISGDKNERFAKAADPSKNVSSHLDKEYSSFYCI